MNANNRYIGLTDEDAYGRPGLLVALLASVEEGPVFAGYVVHPNELVVLRVGHIDVPCSVHKEADGLIELPFSLAPCAKRDPVLSRDIVHPNDPVVAPVGDIDAAGCIYKNVFQVLERFALRA